MYNEFALCNPNSSCHPNYSQSVLVVFVAAVQVFDEEGEEDILNSKIDHVCKDLPQLSKKEVRGDVYMDMDSRLGVCVCCKDDSARCTHDSPHVSTDRQVLS